MSSLIFIGPQFGKQKHRGRWEERKEGANGGNVLIDLFRFCWCHSLVILGEEPGEPGRMTKTHLL